MFLHDNPYFMYQVPEELYGYVVELTGTGLFDGRIRIKNTSTTQADGLMIGRAAQGNPWLIRDIHHLLRYGKTPIAPSVIQITDVMREHIEDMHSFYGEFSGVRIARKHLGWYSKGLYGSTDFRFAVNHELDPEKVKELISQMELAELNAKVSELD